MAALNAAAASAAAPANDNVADAQVLAGALPASASGSNVESTSETNEPNPFDEGDILSVWFRWTAPITGVVELNTCVSTFDTVITVFTASGSVPPFSNLVPVGSADEGCPGLIGGSAGELKTVAGTAYYLQVVAFGEGESGTFTMKLTDVTPPPAAVVVPPPVVPLTPPVIPPIQHKAKPVKSCGKHRKGAGKSAVLAKKKCPKKKGKGKK